MKMTITLFFLLMSTTCLATRGYVGNNPINEIKIIESSSACEPSSGACLTLYFAGGASGCSPASDYISIRLTEPNIKSIESMAYISLTSKKKFRTYATVESCKDADLINSNGATIYDVAH